MVPLNDANRLEELFKAHGHEIGAFLIEPMMGNCCSITATQAVPARRPRACAAEYDVIMIVDEVKTGFRVARGGIQELMGFKADLCTFAKAMANGYPIAAVAGREDIMRLIGDDVLHGGTFTCHSVAIAAAEKTLEILDETSGAEDDRPNYGVRLQQGIGRKFSSDEGSRIPSSGIHRWAACSSVRIRRQTIATGPGQITHSMKRWRRSCTNSELFANRIRVSRGSSAKRTISHALTKRWTASNRRSIRF